VPKWSDLTEEQKERRRATHRRDYEKHRAKRLGYQKDYRENMTEEQKEKERQYHRDMYSKDRDARENARPSDTAARIHKELSSIGKKHGENVKA